MFTIEDYIKDVDKPTFESHVPVPYEAVYNHETRKVIYVTLSHQHHLVMENFEIPITARIDGHYCCFHVCGEMIGNGKLCGEVIVVKDVICGSKTWFLEKRCKKNHKSFIFHLCGANWYLKSDYYCETCDKRGLTVPFSLTLGIDSSPHILPYLLMTTKMSADKTINIMKKENEDLKQEVRKLSASIDELKEMLMFCVGSKEFVKAKNDFEEQNKKF